MGQRITLAAVRVRRATVLVNMADAEGGQKEDDPGHRERQPDDRGDHLHPYPVFHQTSDPRQAAEQHRNYAETVPFGSSSDLK